jgi:hypothetical protein
LENSYLLAEMRESTDSSSSVLLERVKHAFMARTVLAALSGCRLNLPCSDRPRRRRIGFVAPTEFLIGTRNGGVYSLEENLFRSAVLLV